MLGKLTDRLLALLGLDLDFSIGIGRDPFNRITDDLYLGGRPIRAQVPVLKEAGITHVVSCLSEDTLGDVAFLKDDFQSLLIPIRDGIHEDIAGMFPRFFEFVRTAREQDAQAKILVHCEAGVSRSATLAVALVMQRSGKSFFEAYCDVRTKRQEVLPNIGFATQLQRFEFEIVAERRDDESPSSLARYLREVCMAPVEVETLQGALRNHDDDALKALQAIFGDEIPRVIQGVRL